MDNFLRNYTFIALIIIAFVSTIIVYKFNPSFFGDTVFFSSLSISSNQSGEACANYVVNFIDIAYKKKVLIPQSKINDTTTKKITLDAKNRLDLADKNNKIKAVVVDNLKVTIDNDPSYIVTCWITSSFKDKPEDITSYDILYIKVSSNNRKSTFNFLEQNY